jgi:hypothetical protein
LPLVDSRVTGSPISFIISCSPMSAVNTGPVGSAASAFFFFLFRRAARSPNAIFFWGAVEMRGEVGRALRARAYPVRVRL